MASSLLCCCFLLFITVYSAGGFERYAVNRCVFNSSELQDIEYIYSAYYNKLELYRFSSSLGKYVGYTEFGVKQAEYFNNLPGELAMRNAEKERYCLNNVGNEYRAALTKSVEPTVRLYSRTPPAGGHPAMLVCRVYSFYPKTIEVRWLRDGQEVTSDVTTTDEMEDGDWYYQVHSTLEYTPRSGEHISCRVEHASLKEPLITAWGKAAWTAAHLAHLAVSHLSLPPRLTCLTCPPPPDPSMPDSERNKLAIGASGLILGLVLSLAGFIYYKRKARGRILVPTS
ncbi:H-2 class II histocompatibility antigen, E-S beta chain-like isoform 2-T2 [Anableps anableps]